MIQETEDDRLDQSLRDTFSDFDLPPSSHVWTGIESHLSALPSAPRPFPLLLVLPIVGLIGVTVGWLLPRPATVSPAPRPTSEATTKTRLTSLHNRAPVGAETARTLSRSSAEALASHTSKQVAAVLSRPVRKQTAVTVLPKTERRSVASYPVSPPELVASTNTLTPIDSLPLRAVVSVETPLAMSTDSVGQVPVVAQVAAAPNTPLSKAAEILEPLQKEELQEWRPEYRVPTHRLAERGRGLRRIQRNFIRHWQQLFSSHRARVAAQPDF